MIGDVLIVLVVILVRFYFGITCVVIDHGRVVQEALDVSQRPHGEARTRKQNETDESKSQRFQDDLMTMLTMTMTMTLMVQRRSNDGPVTDLVFLEVPCRQVSGFLSACLTLPDVA